MGAETVVACVPPLTLVGWKSANVGGSLGDARDSAARYQSPNHTSPSRRTYIVWPSTSSEI